MRNLLIAVVASLPIACGSSTQISTASSSTGLTIGPDLFAPAPGTILHAGDQITFGARYSICCGYYPVAAVEFVRDDGGELLAACPGGGVNGGGGYRGYMLTTTDPIYKFGLNHSMNAAIAGGSFQSAISASNPCPFGAFFGPINWTAATTRVDVTLNWRIAP